MFNDYMLPYEAAVEAGVGSVMAVSYTHLPALRKEYTNKGYWVNIRLIRYADVLLMGAESANERCV